MVNNEVLLCTNCKHYRPAISPLSRWGGQNPTCDLEEKWQSLKYDVSGRTEPVQGHTVHTYQKDDFRPQCWVQRRYGFILSRLFNYCGKEGRWFEPKDEVRSVENLDQ